MCPISLLFALAVTDGAFDGIESPMDFGHIRIKPGQAVRRLRIRESMAKIPILRRLEVNRSISSDKILPAEKFSDLMKELGQRAGYTGEFLPYSVRRGFGNTIDRKSKSTNSLVVILMCHRGCHCCTKTQANGPQERRRFRTLHLGYIRCRCPKFDQQQST